MEPTKCYRVAGYALTNSAQLDYLKYYFSYMSCYVQRISKTREDNHINVYEKACEQIKKVMKEGLQDQPLVKRQEIHEPFVQYPDVIVQLENDIYQYTGRIPTRYEEEGFYKK